MTKIITSICLLLLLLSCKNEPASFKRIKTEANTADTIFANYADSLFYKLYIVDDYENNPYMLDDHAKCTVLLTNTVTVDDKYFGRMDVLHKAVAYAREIKSDNVTQEIKVLIKKSNGKFDDVFYFHNPIDISKDMTYSGSFSVYEIEPSLQDGSVLQNGKTRDCLKIIFTEKDFSGEGGRIFILSFVRNKNQWALASREKFSNRKGDDAYCIDYGDCTEHNEGRIFLGLGACFIDGFYDTCR